MNDENRENENEAVDAAAGLVSTLQDEVDGLTAQLEVAELRATEAEAQLEAQPTEAPAPAGDDELRALANTVRTAQRNGHPDASKHLDALLSALGA